MDSHPLDYKSSGVDNVGEESALKAIGDRVRRTFSFAGGPGEVGAVHLDLGYFANVIEIGGGQGLAVSTDGVGTKLLVAELLEKYDTVGIDNTTKAQEHEAVNKLSGQLKNKVAKILPLRQYSGNM